MELPNILWNLVLGPSPWARHSMIVFPMAAILLWCSPPVLNIPKLFTGSTRLGITNLDTRTFHI